MSGIAAEILAKSGLRVIVVEEGPRDDWFEDRAIAIGAAAARLFAACGCRDFARADVFLEPDGQFYFLEINTMPGMTETSLMPKSASCVGLDFPLLVRRMAAPALARAAQPVRL